MTLLLLVLIVGSKVAIILFVYPVSIFGIDIGGYSIFSVFILSFLTTALSNPGIPERKYILTQEIQNQIRNSQAEPNYMTCNTCGIFVPSTTKIGHCLSCNICIIGYDHHCGWSSKCIGSGNIFAFRIFLYSGVIYLLFCVFTSIYFLLIKKLC